MRKTDIHRTPGETHTHTSLYFLRFFFRSIYTSTSNRQTPIITNIKNKYIKDTHSHETTQQHIGVRQNNLLLLSMRFDFLIAISNMWEQLVARELMAIDFCLTKTRHYTLAALEISEYSKSDLVGKRGRQTDTGRQEKHTHSHTPLYTFFDFLF